MDNIIEQLIQRIEALEEHCYEFLTTKEAAEYIRFSIPKLYSYTRKKQIPHVRRNGKILFEKRVLTKWMKNEGKPGVEITYVGETKVIFDKRTPSEK